MTDTTARILIDHDGDKGERRTVTLPGEWTEQELHDRIADEFAGDPQLAGIFVEIVDTATEAPTMTEQTYPASTVPTSTNRYACQDVPTGSTDTSPVRIEANSTGNLRRAVCTYHGFVGKWFDSTRAARGSLAGHRRAMQRLDAEQKLAERMTFAAMQRADEQKRAERADAIIADEIADLDLREAVDTVERAEHHSTGNVDRGTRHVGDAADCPICGTDLAGYDTPADFDPAEPIRRALDEPVEPFTDAERAEIARITDALRAATADALALLERLAHRVDEPTDHAAERQLPRAERSAPPYCTNCGGDGYTSDEPGPCPACNGTGKSQGTIGRTYRAPLSTDLRASDVTVEPDTGCYHRAVRHGDDTIGYIAARRREAWIAWGEPSTFRPSWAQQ